MEAWLTNVYGNNMQTTYSCCKSISLTKIINCLMWSSGVTLLSGSNFNKSFFGCFGNGCYEPRTAMTSTANQGILAAMLARKLNIGLGDGGLVQGGLVSRVSTGPKAPTSLGRS